MRKTCTIVAVALAIGPVGATGAEAHHGEAGQRIECKVEVFLPFENPITESPGTTTFAGEGTADCGGRRPGTIQVAGELVGNCGGHHATGTYEVREVSLPLTGHRARGSFQNTRLVSRTAMLSVEPALVAAASFDVTRHPANGCGAVRPDAVGLVPLEAATIRGTILIVLR